MAYIDEHLPRTDDPLGDRLVAIASAHALGVDDGLVRLQRLDEALKSAQSLIEERLEELATAGAGSPLEMAISGAQRLGEVLEVARG